MLPQSPDKVNDLVSLLLEASHQIIEQEDENGQKKQVVIPDSESLWIQTKMVNQPTFARYILVLRKLYDLGLRAENYMTSERAKAIKDQIIMEYKSHKYSIDAKSAETLRDKHNTQGSLNHLLLRQHTERSVTIKGEKKRTLADSIMGKEAKSEEEQY